MDEAQTQAATPRKIARARQRGDVPRSRDLPAAAALLGALAALWSADGVTALRASITHGLSAAASPSLPPPEQALRAAATTLSSVLLVPLAAAFAAALFCALAQVGPLFTLAALQPATSHGRAVQLWSSDRVTGALWNAAKLLGLLLVAWLVVQDSARGVFGLAFGDPAALWAALFLVVGKLALWVGAGWLAIGLVDLVVQHVQHRRRLRMSARELREEQREVYGDPLLRARRRETWRQARLQAGLQELESAGLLLLDSKGRALALSQVAGEPADAAPRIWVKGQGELARRMRERAAQRGLRVAHDDALVRALYPLELTERVPPALYARVAEHWVA